MSIQNYFVSASWTFETSAIDAESGASLVEAVFGALAAEVVLAGENDDWFAEGFDADGALEEGFHFAGGLFG